MQRFSKILTITAAVVAVVAIGFLVGWFGTRRTSSSPPAAPLTAPVSKSASSNPIIALTPRKNRPPTSSTNQTSGSISAATTNLVTDWEDKLDSILGTEGDEADKAKQLLALFPRLPEDGQIEVAQHLSNLVSDQDYAPLGKLLADSKLPEPVLDVLMMDLLNRPNSLKLPLLLEVARDPQHPKAGEAKELLELYLEQDYGTDWNTWQTKLQQWMKDNPD